MNSTEDGHICRPLFQTKDYSFFFSFTSSISWDIFFSHLGGAGDMLLEWGGRLPGEPHVGMCGKDYQLAMMVVEGGDIFIEG